MLEVLNSNIWIYLAYNTKKNIHALQTPHLVQLIMEIVAVLMYLG